jgi:hypothetical protein
MSTGLVIHISSGEDRHTEILTDDRVRIGSSDGSDLKLRSSSLPKPSTNGHLLELVRRDGNYHIVAFDTSLELTKNSNEFAIGDTIADGDEIRVVGSDLVLQFFPIRSLPAVVPSGSKETHVAPFIETAALESLATGNNRGSMAGATAQRALRPARAAAVARYIRSRVSSSGWLSIG